MYFVMIVYLFTLVFVGFVVSGGGFVIFFFLFWGGRGNGTKY